MIPALCLSAAKFFVCGELAGVPLIYIYYRHSIVLIFVVSRAPWIKSCWNFGKYYIIPNVNTVVVGGTAQRNDYSTNVSVEDTEDILSNVVRLFSDMKEAELVSKQRFAGFHHVILAGAGVGRPTSGSRKRLPSRLRVC
jgi:glycine/D-amino acid oxidase-like deaminating enzyme